MSLRARYVLIALALMLLGCIGAFGYLYWLWLMGERFQ